MDTVEKYNLWWLAMVFQCLPPEGRRELFEDATEILEFYQERAEFSAPPLPDPIPIKLKLIYKGKLKPHLIDYDS